MVISDAAISSSSEHLEKILNIRTLLILGTPGSDVHERLKQRLKLQGRLLTAKKEYNSVKH